MSIENIQRVNAYLTQAGTFFLTTVSENKPKCRPFGFHMIDNDRIYFGVGTFKDVYKQIKANPEVEICAMKDKEFLRYYGTAVFETDDTLSQGALDMMPNMKRIYNDETGFKLAMFYLSDATAEFRTMMGISESIAL